jgi:hypothetical protein
MHGATGQRKVSGNDQLALSCSAQNGGAISSWHLILPCSGVLLTENLELLKAREYGFDVKKIDTERLVSLHS